MITPDHISALVKENGVIAMSIAFDVLVRMEEYEICQVIQDFARESVMEAIDIYGDRGANMRYCPLIVGPEAWKLYQELGTNMRSIYECEKWALDIVNELTKSTDSYPQASS